MCVPRFFSSSSSAASGDGRGGNGRRAIAMGHVGRAEAEQHVQTSLVLLEKREAHFETQIAELKIKIHKAIAAKNKPAAMTLLKRRKMLESQQQKLSGARTNLEQQQFAIENAALSMGTMHAMRSGANVMMDMQRGMSVEDVDEIAVDFKEQMEVADNIGNAISQPLTDDMAVFDGEAEEELEAEMARMEAEQREHAEKLRSHDVERMMAEAPAALRNPVGGGKGGGGGSVKNDTPTKAADTAMAAGKID